MDCYLVQRPLVDTRSQTSVLLGHEEKKLEATGDVEGGYSLDVKLPRYTPPWPSVLGVTVDKSYHGALAHPESDLLHSPMAGAEVTGRLSSGRIHH